MKDWKKVKLGTLLTESKVESKSPDPDKRISVKLNVNGVEKRPLTKDKKGATKYFIRKAGQFIYGKQNLHKGAFGLVPEELDGYESSSDIPAFDVDESCYPEWIYYFFKKGNFYLKLESLAKGVGSKRIHPHQIFDLDIFLPEKEEQKEILDQIEVIKNNHDALISEIESQETLLAQLRQSILQDAIKGNLTTEWRKQNPDIEPASELLKRIQAEKEQLIKEKKIKKEKPLPKIKADEIPFEIPESWEWCRPNDISMAIVDCPHSTPKFKSEGFLCVDTTCMDDNGNLILSAVRRVDQITFHERNRRLIPKPGDIIYAREGSIGKSIVIPENLEVCLGQRVMIYRLHKELNPHLFRYILVSPMFMSQILKAHKGVGAKHVNMSDLRSLPVPLIPIDEQEKLYIQLIKFQLIFDSITNEIINNKERLILLMSDFLVTILGSENELKISPNSGKVEQIKKTHRKQVFDSKTTFMELVELLKKHGRLHAEDLWGMSKFPDDIDQFYAELKKQIEEKKSIKESTEKGYLELA